MRRLIAPVVLAAALLSAPAQAAERRWPVGSVERVRVEAPVKVRIVTGGGNGVRATGADRAVLDALDLRTDGATLTIRALRKGPLAAGMPAEILVATPRLDTLALFAPATVTVDALRGARASVSVAGAGDVTIARVDADTFVATLVGEGTITAAGRAREVRLAGNGPGTLDAGRLLAERAQVQAAGDIIIRAAARSTAQVTAGPDAQVSVEGRPQCTIRAAKPAAVRC
ncbi:hypothetical protein J2Y58_002386 [Sphingomonas sp. BE138]|uniref:GIN domain-containing protein n=1 Tax=Sphingomonas sp. BE138 TaxID=2817845 RepID=UPI00285B78A9|nr:DUF2807 domain-containing protein [Sphingomonas sp. BE138]MDR6789017.1 hypothetical protein [Sphingomonas sp. BE138]